MDLTPYVEHLRSDLAEAAAAGGPEAREAAERLALALDPSARMVLLEALSDATAEITGELDDTSVEVRLRGREPQFVVERLHVEPAGQDTAGQDTAGQAPPGQDAAEEVDEPLEDESDTLARVTVRIPESLKERAEELASTGSQSLNAWIVQAIRFAARERAINIDLDLASRLFTAPGAPGGPGPGGRSRTSRRVQGWSR